MTRGWHEVPAVEQSTSITRDASFGYVCGRCSRCCQHKHIQLDPYEIARLARAKRSKMPRKPERATVSPARPDAVAGKAAVLGALSLLSASMGLVLADGP